MSDKVVRPSFESPKGRQTAKADREVANAILAIREHAETLAAAAEVLCAAYPIDANDLASYARMIGKQAGAALDISVCIYQKRAGQ